ncbi:MAG: class I SAM-dependent methyltransferase [bacterium]|nr:MAG: class I SAM-dependent methyltransferase [bacterium]
MEGYYDEILSAEKLRQAYSIAPPRVRRYLEAEIEYVLRHLNPGDTVLELGCGYGRVLRHFARAAQIVVGIDTSPASLLLGQETLSDLGNCHLVCMDAVHLGFTRWTFDCVVCIQNGISAFHVDQRALISESIRVTRRGGTVLFSSYSDRFWVDRLRWFEMQADAGLLGEIDRERTGDGVIVCKDGFRATTVLKPQFESLTAGLDADVSVTEVDRSSLFCCIVPGIGRNGSR